MRRQFPLAVALTLLLAACGQPGTEPPESVRTPDSIPEIRMEIPEEPHQPKPEHGDSEAEISQSGAYRLTAVEQTVTVPKPRVGEDLWGLPVPEGFEKQVMQIPVQFSDPNIPDIIHQYVTYTAEDGSSIVVNDLTPNPEAFLAAFHSRDAEAAGEALRNSFYDNVRGEFRELGERCVFVQHYTLPANPQQNRPTAQDRVELYLTGLDKNSQGNAMVLRFSGTGPSAEAAMEAIAKEL